MPAEITSYFINIICIIGVQTFWVKRHTVWKAHWEGVNSCTFNFASRFSEERKHSWLTLLISSFRCCRRNSLRVFLDHLCEFESIWRHLCLKPSRWFAFGHLFNYICFQFRNSSILFSVVLFCLPWQHDWWTCHCYSFAVFKSTNHDDVFFWAMIKCCPSKIT